MFSKTFKASEIQTVLDFLKSATLPPAPAPATPRPLEGSFFYGYISGVPDVEPISLVFQSNGIVSGYRADGVIVRGTWRLVGQHLTMEFPWAFGTDVFQGIWQGDKISGTGVNPFGTWTWTLTR